VRTNEAGFEHVTFKGESEGAMVASVGDSVGAGSGGAGAGKGSEDSQPTRERSGALGESEADPQELWLVRSESNQLLGPFVRTQLKEQIESGLYSPEVEICRANGYWISLHEDQELVSQLGIRHPGRRHSVRDRDDITQNDITPPAFVVSGAPQAMGPRGGNVSAAAAAPSGQKKTPVSAGAGGPLLKTSESGDGEGGASWATQFWVFGVGALLLILFRLFSH
jgi:hypothetical protein